MFPENITDMHNIRIMLEEGLFPDYDVVPVDGLNPPEEEEEEEEEEEPKPRKKKAKKAAGGSRNSRLASLLEQA